MRKTIVRTLAISAILAVPFAGATMASAHAAPAKAAASTSTGIKAITGNWSRVLWPDDGPSFDQLTVSSKGKVQLGGQLDDIYNCAGTVKATGKNHFLFTLTCKAGGNPREKAKAEYNPKTHILTVHIGRGETFTR
jgi:hypothetical protein